MVYKYLVAVVLFIFLNINANNAQQSSVNAEGIYQTNVSNNNSKWGLLGLFGLLGLVGIFKKDKTTDLINAHTP